MFSGARNPTVLLGILSDVTGSQKSKMAASNLEADMNAGRRDAEFAATSAEVHHITWDDLIAAKWPMPPKICKLCSGKAGKPY